MAAAVPGIATFILRLGCRLCGTRAVKKRPSMEDCTDMYEPGPNPCGTVTSIHPVSPGGRGKGCVAGGCVEGLMSCLDDRTRADSFCVGFGSLRWKQTR